MVTPQYLSRCFICECCGVNKAVTQAPNTERVDRPNGIYQVSVDGPICESCANVFGWEVAPE